MARGWRSSAGLGDEVVRAGWRRKAGKRAGAAAGAAVAGAADEAGSGARGVGVGAASATSGRWAARRRRRRVVRPGDRLPQPRRRRWLSLRGA